MCINSLFRKGGARPTALDTTQYTIAEHGIGSTLQALANVCLPIERQHPPGLVVKLSSNNPFRNRAASPVSKSNFPSPQASAFGLPSNVPERPVSRNPFLDQTTNTPTEPLRQRPVSPTIEAFADASQLVASKPVMNGHALELFVGFHCRPYVDQAGIILINVVVCRRISTLMKNLAATESCHERVRWFPQDYLDPKTFDLIPEAGLHPLFIVHLDRTKKSNSKHVKVLNHESLRTGLTYLPILPTLGNPDDQGAILSLLSQIDLVNR